MKRRFVLGALTALLAACSPGGQGNFSTPTKTLEIVSWWTSGSERPALDVLIDQFHKANPEVTVERASIAGGAGSNVQVALATRLRDGNPPDIWQTFDGASLRANAEAGRIADVSQVFEADKLAAAIPAPVLDALTWEGKRWGVPTGAHRQNMLWYNPAVLRKARVEPPVPGYTFERFLADMNVLKVSGVQPFCLGAGDRFTTTELFETILLGEIGQQGWADIAADRFDWNGPRVRRALVRLGKVLDFADPSARLSWDEAARQFAQGRCAFLSMNDSLYGELVAGGVKPADIGFIAFPGTEDAFLAVVDTFVVARAARNGVNALQFLTVIGTAQSETAFAKLKGPAPLRADADVASLPAYQRAAFKALHEAAILRSITHGELLGTGLQQAIYDGVAAFARSRDPDEFTDKIQQAVNAGVPTGY